MVDVAVCGRRASSGSCCFLGLALRGGFGFVGESGDGADVELKGKEVSVAGL